MAKRKRSKRPGHPKPAPVPAPETERGEFTELAETVATQPGTSPVLSGGDVDADWGRAHLSGDEAVGGSVATPDQDIVDEIGHALGVEQAPDAPVQTSEEILRERDRQRWRIEREAAESKDEG